MRKTILFLIAALTIVSCSTDVKLNAPYKKITVIYGLLDPDGNGDGASNDLDTQWVKINKTFLGEGNNSLYAQVRDSLEYSDDEFAKKVVQQIHDGHVIKEFELISKEVSNKNMNGVFYAPLQTVYYFVPDSTGLEGADHYKILLQFIDGREVSATTNIIEYGQFAWRTPQANKAMVLARTNSSSPSAAPTFVDAVPVQWYPVNNAEIYDLSLRFYYTEFVYDNPQWTGSPLSVEKKHIDYHVGYTDKSKISPSGFLEVNFNGRALYNLLETSLRKDPNIRRQIGEYSEEYTRCFELRLGIGNRIMADYINVNQASTGVVQEKPIYSNVANGLGLFAGRATQMLMNIPLISKNNNGVLITGNLDAFFLPGIVDLNFCDPNPASNYFCGN